MTGIPKKRMNDIEEAGFKSYVQLSWVLLSCILGGCLGLHLVLFFYGRFKDHTQPISPNPKTLAKALDRDNQCALDAIDRDSVYRFFMASYWQGWGVSLFMLALQFWMLHIFVKASEIELSNDNSDLVYTFKCPRDSDECRDTDGMGPMCFSIHVCSPSLCVYACT